jgi:hypothetical protein
MIGYPISVAELNHRIETAHPTRPGHGGAPRKNANKTLAWRQRAKVEILRLRHHKTYSEGIYGEFWQDLLRVFAAIQGDGKCGYCEKKLNRRGRGGVDGDIDHYRCKDGVVKWNSAHGVNTGGSDQDCYYLLTFFPSNYVLACRTCNEDLKRNHFPVAGPRCCPHSCNVTDLKAEQPYLIHPLDPSEPDPETLITFMGTVPVPCAPRGTHDYWRAMITIELFGLSSGTRHKNFRRGP